MTVENLITDHINIWSSALQTRSTAGRGSNGKIDLYGIKKLRELILELAVRGKLVPQDPNDEPASELLKRITAEKAELVKQGKIKKQKPLPEISEDEKPFELPVGWEWMRLIELGSWAIGSGFPISIQGITDEDILMCKVSDMNLQGNEKFIISTNNTISECAALQQKINISDPGTVIFPKIGGAIATNKRRILTKKTAIDNNCLGIKPFSTLISEWFFLILNSIDMSKYQSGTSVPAINQSVIGNISIALPPLDMQERIAEKVEELMSLCDQLGQQSLTSLDAHQQLVETLLATLTDSQNAEELAENWARISQHFDTLFTTEASIDALKQTILQLAVMGKLVPQDPSDEPASELLKRIDQENAKLVKDGKIKKQAPLPPINDEDKPFELPEGWEWIKFGHIGDIKGGGTPSKNNPDFWDGDTPWISPKDMKVDYISQGELSISQSAVMNSSVHLIPKNSLLFVVRGMILAHTFPAAVTEREVTINQDMKAITTSLFNTDFLLKMIQGSSDRVLSLVDRSSHGTCKLVSERIFNLVLPVPPLEEQIRISKHVNMLLDICSRLRANLILAQQTQLHLADAITDAALN